MPHSLWRPLAATLLLLAAVPAAANASSTASIRAFGAGAGTFKLAVDGTTETASVKNGHVSPRFSTRTGRHVFTALSKSGRRLAKGHFRVAAGLRYTVALARDAHGRDKLVLIAEPSAVAGKAVYRIANLTPRSSDFTIGTPPLRVAHSLAFGATTSTLQVGGTASATGSLAVHGVRGGTVVATSSLVDATASTTTFALVRKGSGASLVRLPWDTAPPVPLKMAVIAGTRHVGSSVTCSGDTWSGAPSVTRQWTADGADLVGATATSLALVQATHAGKAIACRVVATRAGQTVTLRPTGFALPLPPVNVTPPTVSGAPTLGTVVTCEPGTWTGDTDVPTYRWLHVGVAISGETGSTYTLAAGDQGLAITCEETASNAGGVTAAVSSNQKIGGAPANTVLPTLTGTFQGGQTISVVNGTWDPANAVLTHTWYHCKAGACAPVAAQPDPDTSYVPTDADSGYTLYVAETATDAIDSSLVDTERSLDSDVVIPQAPEVALATTLSSDTATSAGVGATITTHGLTTTVTAEFGTDNTYGTPATPVPASVLGTSSHGDVTATLSGLAPSVVYHYHFVATSTSGATDSGEGVFLSAPALDASAVTITGTEALGQDVTCDRGLWTNDGDNTYTYQWLRNGQPIDGETQPTHTLTSVDAAGGTTVVSCAVTGSNDGFSGFAGGATTVTSSNTVTLPLAPAVQNEAVTGTASTFTTLNGDVDTRGVVGETWFEWGIDTTYGNSTTPAPTSGTAGFEAAAPALIPDGSLLNPSTEYHFRLDALNPGGETDGTDHTFVTAPDVSGDAPSLLPADTSAVKVGDTVTCLPGDWTTGDFPNTFGYDWKRTDFVNDPVLIAGQTGPGYTLTADDAGFSVYCEVTATNAGGSTTYTTQTVDLPTLPAVVIAPSLSYTTLNDGDTITATPGTYDNAELGQTGQWLRCDDQGANCTPIAGETGLTYKVFITDDQGHTLRYEETAVNRGGQTTVDSDQTIPI